ncbi:MAG: crossover junction endodeoxyribonuclease RuvC [Rhodospirillaceae bacterium]|nr:crossover junction endodeoxyribonuclease RuvC [Rhodospirillaceae bacterium]
MIIIGLDPGLRATGWGVILVEGNRISHLSNGTISVPIKPGLGERLACLHRGLEKLMRDYTPDEAAVEETFVNRNASSTLKLGQARGVVMAVPSLCGVRVFEYAATKVKQSLVGSGHAKKGQVMAMVRTFLPSAVVEKSDAADALAVAICHAHLRQTTHRISIMGTEQ